MQLLGAVSKLAVLSSLITSALGQCQADMQYGPYSGGDIGSDPSFCLGQGEGYWTFAMGLTETSIPGSFNQIADFFIFDNACNLKGWFTNPTCGIPWTVEANFLADVLTVQSVSMEVGGAGYFFAYGNGLYSIGNNHCGCSTSSGFAWASEGCKCAFIQDGMLPANYSDSK